MENISKKTILETVDTAIEYSGKLGKNLNSVLGAEQQVNETAEESLAEIDAVFDELTKSVLDALNKRRETLKKTVCSIREEGLTPLKGCREVIKQTLKNTQCYICEGQDLLDLCDKDRIDSDRCLKFLDQSSLLGSLPAVPNMEEVPAITFQLNLDSLQSSLVSSILSAGEVSRMGPVQITSVLEKPGALLVHWEEATIATREAGSGQTSSDEVPSSPISETDDFEAAQTVPQLLYHRHDLSLECFEIVDVDGDIYDSWSEMSSVGAEITRQHLELLLTAEQKQSSSADVYFLISRCVKLMWYSRQLNMSLPGTLFLSDSEVIAEVMFSN